MSSRSEQYIARAENCQQYADAVQSLGEKILYQELATQWMRLAEQADKTDEAGNAASLAPLSAPCAGAQFRQHREGQLNPSWPAMRKRRPGDAEQPLMTSAGKARSRSKKKPRAWPGVLLQDRRLLDESGQAPSGCRAGLFASRQRPSVSRRAAPEASWRPNASRCNSPCQTLSSVRSAWLPSRHHGLLNPANRQIRTRTSGGVGGANSRDLPYPDSAA